MKQSLAYSSKTNLEITDAEIAAAKEVRESVKDVLKKLDKAIKVILDFKAAIVQKRPSQDELVSKYKGRFLRYRRRITTVFNDFLVSIKKIIDKLAIISDPDMMRLKEILIAEIGELSDGAEAVMDLLKEPDKEGFTSTLERIAVQIEKRQKSIKDVIDNQLIGHIDADILGKLKISELRFRIKRNSRIIKQLARRK